MPQIHRLYIPDVNMHVDCIDVTGADAKIVSQVLRLQEGDRLTVLDGRGQVIETQIQNKVTKAVKLKKINQQMLPKLSPSIQVSIGALKGDKSTWVLQKLTEIGVQRITFFDGDHSVAKTDKKKKTKYETTCVEALRQSGNPYLPEVDFYNSLSGCLDAHKDADIKICLHEKEASSHSPNVQIKNLSLSML
ncbi:MAG: RsmE family RNA methyltransferase [Bdellovibrionota bacterium]